MLKNQILQPELLAPAGSFEGLKAVIQAGADAVYLGGNAFGARAYARNFSDEELLQAIDYAHLYNRKVYLTVNTLCKEEEMEAVFRYLLPLYEQGLDAVLVQDLGILRMIRRLFPDLPVHASTQMNVTGVNGVRLLEKEGVSRAVLARELSLEEIRRIHEVSPVELETFVHGALCYCYSGRCLMSSLIGGRSGNRGRCAQPCRLPWSAAWAGKKNKKDLCPISPKDMNTIEILPDILEAGVFSLKIEGRMKHAGYAAGVTSVYRKYLDRYLEKGRERYSVEEEDLRYLKGLFSRGGSTEGYYHRYNGPAMMSFSNEKKSTIQGTLPEEKPIPAEGSVRLVCGEPALLTVRCRDTEITVPGPVVQRAQKAPVTEEDIRSRMGRMGGTGFVWDRLQVDAEEDIFLPVAALNALRRGAVRTVAEALLAPGRRQYPRDRVLESPSPDMKDRKAGGVPSAVRFSVSCETKDQVKALLAEEGISALYVPEECLEMALEEKRRRPSSCPEIFLLFPQVSRWEVQDDDIARFRGYLEAGLSGFVVRDFEMYAAFVLHGLSDVCVTDSSLYSWNQEAILFLREHGCLRNTAPVELNASEMKKRDNTDSEIPVYGYMPMMISAQCLQKNLASCTRDGRLLYLEDRYHARFPVQCVCRPWKGTDTDRKQCCYNIIYNSIPFGLLKEREEVLRLGGAGLRLSFTVEPPADAVRIFRDFRDAFRSGREPAGSLRMTRGHFRRGVE